MFSESGYNSDFTSPQHAGNSTVFKKPDGKE